MNKDTGGAAFPVGIAADSKQDGWLNEGMSLRDFFAAKAMQGLLANSTIPSDFNGEDEATKWLAKVSYLTADAMLEARKVI